MTLYVNGKTHTGRTTNVSRGGLCADISEAIAVGKDLDVDIQLVFDEETTSEALRIPGRVAWCTTLDDAFQIGLSFRPMSKELDEYLTMFLRYLHDGTKSVRSKRESTVDKRFG